MYQNHRYSQLVFYIEACYTYAVTAAHRNESSYATYCHTDMKLPCLGDEFSVNWMEDSDVKDINNETLDEQYWIVKNLTKRSHVMRYGDLRITSNPVAWFQGEERLIKKSMHSDIENLSKGESWPALDVELLSLYQLKKSTNDPREAKRIEHSIREILEVLSCS
ncbi:peptidase C13 family protein [Oesophagostomum dentatum]|uniref:Peptidase C13 family protein n=1 Tax=Oesophagostomum dentatum TaxID=61180 RepID=A0A0B1TCP4_OESDE|nr:peptidase C13 family protein [Oesophagostomum dentatum]